MTEPPEVHGPSTVGFTPGLPAFYANLVGATASAHDIRIEFGKGGPGGGTYEVAVYLPYPALKQTLGMLQGLLETYEKQFGPVNIQPIGSESKP